MMSCKTLPETVTGITVDDFVTSPSGNGINGYRYHPDYEIHGCMLDSVMHRTVS